MDADYEEMAKIEFHAGLYVNKDGFPILPGVMVEASMVNAAKTEKSGRQAKSALQVLDDSVLEYDGPKDAKELFADPKFRLVSQVRNQNARIMRVRPMLSEWSAVVNVRYEDSILNKSQITNWLRIAGALCGVGDWRPRYGRFNSVEV